MKEQTLSEQIGTLREFNRVLPTGSSEEFIAVVQIKDFIKKLKEEIKRNKNKDLHLTIRQFDLLIEIVDKLAGEKLVVTNG